MKQRCAPKTSCAQRCQQCGSEAVLSDLVLLKTGFSHELTCTSLPYSHVRPLLVCSPRSTGIQSARPHCRGSSVSLPTIAHISACNAQKSLSLNSTDLVNSPCGANSSTAGAAGGGTLSKSNTLGRRQMLAKPSRAWPGRAWAF